MTLEVDLSEFRAAYLAEMEELLLTAEAACSALARALEDGSPARSFVRELLRAVHTMKGISAMMNAEPVVDLAHHLEELLRAVDAADLTLDERRFA
ncbi:MAG: Hpt domain-containing protein, partial [Polyangiaceae bacterium]